MHKKADEKKRQSEDPCFPCMHLVHLVHLIPQRGKASRRRKQPVLLPPAKAWESNTSCAFLCMHLRCNPFGESMHKMQPLWKKKATGTCISVAYARVNNYLFLHECHLYSLLILLISILDHFMFNNQQIKIYFILFLLFCVASSKGIIIYNEETLVALSFLLFVVFCLSYFGNTVKESLDERSSLIQFQLENFHRLKEDALQELLSLHKRSLQLKTLFPSIKKDTENQLSSTISSGSETASSIELDNRFCEQIQQKLSTFQSSKALLQQRLQKSIALTIKLQVLGKIQNNKQGKNSGQIAKQVQQSLKLLAV